MTFISVSLAAVFHNIENLISLIFFGLLIIISRYLRAGTAVFI